MGSAVRVPTRAKDARVGQPRRGWCPQRAEQWTELSPAAKPQAKFAEILTVGFPRRLLAEAHPGFRDDHGIAWVLGIVTDRCRQAEAAGVEINLLAQVGDVLRGLVGDSGHVVVV